MEVAAGYREWAPPPTLRPALSCLWSSRIPDQPPELGPASEVLVLPDGCRDLIWQQGQGAFVAGPDTGPVPAPVLPGAVLVAVRFRPGAGGDLLGVPLSELRDQRVGLADLRPEDGPPDRALLEACHLLASPSARTGIVAGQVGLSPRQLRRRAEAAVGYGPKLLQRVLRFRRFVSLIDATAGAADLAEAAVASGYADQPHLTRDTVELSGLPPAALVRARHPGARVG